MSAAELAHTTFPPKRWTVDELIMEGIPQTLDGDGGIGKSNTAQGMSVAVAAGATIFGKQTIQSSVLFITHEDDYPDCKSTMQAYTEHLGVEFDKLPLHTWSLQSDDITLAIVGDRGEWKRGPFYAAFESKLAATPGMFVVLDCRSDVVQMNEVLREPPNTFYKTVLTPLCKKYRATILVLCHPSKASMSDGSWYSGGTGNKSALRNKLVMKLADAAPNADPEGPRLFGVLKRNKGKRGGLMVLTFDPVREVFIAQDDAAVMADRRETYDLVVKAIYELIGKGLDVTCSPNAAGHTPKAVASYINETHKPARSITWKEVQAQMKLAEQFGALRHVPAAGHKKSHYEVPDSSEDFRS